MKHIVEPLIQWFDTNKRDLPWRHNRTFYRVWISEIMLQQTQVKTVIPYYLKFMERFPTLESLAKSPLDDVLKHWEGLGYYSRARNLHKGAHYIQNELAGTFPETYNETIKVPGFGPYTTAAVLSLSANKKHAVVDGNVIRVISRLYDISNDMRIEKNKAQIQSIVDELIPDHQPANFNESMMEFGARICTPKLPNCDACFLSAECNAYKNNSVLERPYKSKKTKVPTKKNDVAIYFTDQQFVIEKRSTDEMLGGLWKLPDHDLKHGKKLGMIKHTYSHFKLELTGYILQEKIALKRNQKRVYLKDISEYAFDNATKKMFELLFKYISENSLNS